MTVSVYSDTRPHDYLRLSDLVRVSLSTISTSLKLWTKFNIGAYVGW
jgi:hypothetical protein